jgi:hypothetical protein
MGTLLRSFTLLAALLLFTPSSSAQQAIGEEESSDDRPRVFNNFDIAPRSAQKQQKSEKSAQPENIPVKVEKKVSSKKAVMKAPKPGATEDVREKKKEGYWQSEPDVAPSQQTPPPAPKIYSELRTSIDDSGRLVLTSDTIVVKPEVKMKLVQRPFEGTGNEQIDGIIQKTAKKHEIDPRLILELIRQESGFKSHAVSNKGARGLMQLIPATAARFGVRSIHDPAENIEGGTKYLRFLLDLFEGNLELALAGYNAGENAVKKYNYQIPPYRETRDYVRSITARYRSKYHQYVPVKTEATVARNAPLATFTAEDGKVILSNNY